MTPAHHAKPPPPPRPRAAHRGAHGGRPHARAGGVLLQRPGPRRRRTRGSTTRPGSSPRPGARRSTSPTRTSTSSTTAAPSRSSTSRRLRGSVRKMLAGVRCTEQVEECGEYVSLGGKTTDDAPGGLPRDRDEPGGHERGRQRRDVRGAQRLRERRLLLPRTGARPAPARPAGRASTAWGAASASARRRRTGPTRATAPACSTWRRTRSSRPPRARPSCRRSPSRPDASQPFDTIGAFASGAVIAQSNTPGTRRAALRARPRRPVHHLVRHRRRSRAGRAEPVPARLRRTDGGRPALQRRAPDGRRPLRQLPRFHAPGRARRARRLGPGHDGNQNAIVSAHQISNQPAVGLSVNNWGAKPSFEYYLTGVSAGPTEVAHIPPPAIVAASQQTSAPMLTSRASS